MKIRSSLVSNSSSSSFILYGFKVSREQQNMLAGDKDFYDWAEDKGLDYAYLDGYDYDLVGKYLHDWDEYEITELSMPDLQVKLDEVKDKIGDYGLGEAKVFAGTRSC
jgi:hypothetical protein